MAFTNNRSPVLPAARSGEGDAVTARKRLERSACALARAWRAFVWDYPWDLFLVALDEIANSTG